MREAQEHLAAIEVEVASLRAQLAKLRAAKPVAEMTVHDYYELHPECRELVYERIRQDNWATASSGEGARGPAAH